MRDIYWECNERKDGTHDEILSDFTDKTLEGEFTNEELGRFLVTTNFTEGDGSGAEAMRLQVHTTLRNATRSRVREIPKLGSLFTSGVVR